MPALGLTTAAIILARFVIPAGAHDPPGTKVTWNSDIARLVSARCVRCHSPDGKGPMSLVTYEDARPWARAIREEVLARRMPKWHAARGYGQFANDPSLSPFEIALFVAWADGGAVRGAAPPPTEPPAEAPVNPSGPGHAVTLRCDKEMLPAGRLLALTPQLDEGASAGFTAVFPDGRREVVAWIRHYEQEFAETYWLRKPLDVPKGSRLYVEATGKCSVLLHVEITHPPSPRTPPSTPSRRAGPVSRACRRPVREKSL
jgi:hypothetical protein